MRLSVNKKKMQIFSQKAYFFDIFYLTRFTIAGIMRHDEGIPERTEERKLEIAPSQSNAKRHKKFKNMVN